MKSKYSLSKFFRKCLGLFYLALVFGSTGLLFSCGKPDKKAEEIACIGNCSEADLNAPVDEPIPENGPNPTPDPVDLPTLNPEEIAQNDPKETPRQNPEVEEERGPLPPFRASWNLPISTYNKANNFLKRNYQRIRNRRYVTVIDFRQHSSKKRFYLFDLQTGKVEQHITSHGKNSDPDNDGFANQFSNRVGSLQSSLGFYFTLGTYYGKNGLSLRLRGLEPTNSRAEERAVVIHKANYVSNRGSRAGRSWGCPALDPGIAYSVIERIKGGSVLLIDR